MNKHTAQELKQWQALPLEVKIAMTKNRIRGWVDAFGEDGVYVSFSGGKDSTVLLDIVRQDYPNIPAVFVDVPTQYPELKTFAIDFCKNNDIVLEILKPQISFAEVCKKYGFPLISKEVSKKISEAKSKSDGYAMKSFIPESEGGREQRYNYSKYRFLLQSPFSVDSKCCTVMKKNPSKKYENKTGRKPIIATMACESAVRTQEWLVNGCNAFDKKGQRATRLAFGQSKMCCATSKLMHCQYVVYTVMLWMT